MNEIAIPGNGNPSERAREYLLASLVGVEDRAVSFENEQYIDWSCGGGEKLNFECGDEDGNVAQLRLSRNDLESLQRALTIYLLSN